MSEFFQHFHLLRPWWLLALLPVLWLLYAYFQKQRQGGAWQSVIDPQFQRLLLGEAAQKKPPLWPIWATGILATSMLIALSGPTWQEVKIPAEKNRQATVIVLDLSLSMLADDMKPNRITRAGYKLNDYLKQHKQIATGMVAYAATAHTIAPISDDPATLLSILPTLNPTIMPAFGSEPINAMHKALQLFEGSHVQSKHILWVTDDVEATQTAELRQFFNDNQIQLSMLLVGTEKGGTIHIPDYGLLKDNAGAIVIPKLPKQRLESFADRLDANSLLLQSAHGNLSELSPRRSASRSNEETDGQNQQTVSWLDEGAWLIALLLPFFALAYRRGWLFSLLLISLPVSLLGQPTPAYAEPKTGEMEVLDVFKSPNRQGYEKWLEGDYAGAEDRFESHPWKGASFYRMGDYKQAIKMFSLDETARGHYNLGNAYAQLGEFEKAKTAYEKALTLRKDFPEAAKNLSIMDQLLQQEESNPQQANGENSQKNNQNGAETPPPPPQQKAQKDSKQPQSNQQGNQEAESGKNGEHGKDGEKGENSDLDKSAESEPKNQNQNADSANRNEQNGDPSNSQNPQSKSGLSGRMSEEEMAKSRASGDSLIDQQGQQTSAKQDSTEGAELSSADKQKTQLSAEALAKQRQQQEAQQAKQYWLDQIPDQPGLFLQRKFDYQYQNSQQPPPSDKTW